MTDGLKYFALKDILTVVVYGEKYSFFIDHENIKIFSTLIKKSEGDYKGFFVEWKCKDNNDFYRTLDNVQGWNIPKGDEFILQTEKIIGGKIFNGEKDNINPQHYKLMGDLQVIDVIDFVCKDLSGEKGYCLGNALKYLIRSNKKGVMLEDIKKAEWYVKRLIGYLEGDKNA